ncbi:MAG: right-handed parallel beta-helix repeat-containing protein [Thermoanaerobaculia bacterium]|nr:right-handed parallel beta-helix repeat-containing protein [Thermoanaerobaculia bacterium]
MTSTHRTAYATVILAAVLSAVASQAATFHVTNLASGGAGSLRQAILDANSNAGPDDITFSVALTGTIELASVLPQVTGPVNIHGPGAMQVTVDANQLGRVLEFAAAPGTSHSLFDLTLTGGRTFGADGAGVLLGTGQDLTLEEVRLVGNEVTNNSGGGLMAEASTSVVFVRSEVSGNAAYAGGGVFALGTLESTQSTFHHNAAVLQGGGLAVDVVELRETTVSGNGAPGSDFTIGEGGGIFVFDGGELTMYQTTVVGNVADSGPGVFLLNTAEAAGLGGNIIAGNRFDGSGNEFNCNTPLGIVDNHNLSGDASCGFTGISDLQNTDPQLLPLISAGGPTPTHVPLSGSPAIDGSDDLYCAAVDQRGFVRPVDGDAIPGAECDMGSTEYAPGTDDALVTIFSDDFDAGNTSSWSATVP